MLKKDMVTNTMENMANGMVADAIVADAIVAAIMVADAIVAAIMVADAIVADGDGAGANKMANDFFFSIHLVRP